VERGILQGLAAFRWAAWTWTATVLLVARHDLVRPWLAVLLVGLALVVTATFTVILRLDPLVLLRPAPVVAELTVAVALVVCDGWAFGADHAFSTSQSLGVAWPMAAVLSAGVAFGGWAGAVAGIGGGFARLGGALANGASLTGGGRVLSLASTVFLYALAGGVAGYVALLLRRAEREISAARAREEVARTLHDGVLQTLAVVERRADDPALARLAREQERELREYLFGAMATGRANRERLGIALRAAAGRFEDAFGGRAQVVLDDDLPSLQEDDVRALAGAVGEALTNAGKHGGARRVTVYAEPAERGGVFCSIKDNGCGYDVSSVSEGVGLTRSIRGRIAEIDGRVEIDSAPGRGTEVRLWLPR
jgi:signal transduction histidine kinase